MNLWTHGNFHTCILCTSLARSDNGTVSLFQSSRQHPTFSHGRFLSSVSPAMIKGCGQQLVPNTKIKTAKISAGEKMGFSWKFGPAKISCCTILHNVYKILHNVYKDVYKDVYKILQDVYKILHDVYKILHNVYKIVRMFYMYAKKVMFAIFCACTAL